MQDEKNITQAEKRLKTAKDKIPKQKRLVKKRIYDESQNKEKTRLCFEESERPPNAGKLHFYLTQPLRHMSRLVHNKIRSVEKDNTAVESAHKTEQVAESAVSLTARRIYKHSQDKKLKPYREAEKAERELIKAKADHEYKKLTQENPNIASNPFSRFLQKQQIKKQYTKNARNINKTGRKTARTAVDTAKKAAEKSAEFIKKHPKAIIVSVSVLLSLALIFSSITACVSVISAPFSSVLGTTYLSDEKDILSAENTYLELERELKNRIVNIRETHYSYDEYRIDTDYIGHDAHILTSLLSSIHTVYSQEDVQNTISTIFDMQYHLELTEESEIRYKTKRRKKIDENGNEYTETYKVSYTYRILNVKLHTKDLYDVANNILTDEQKTMFEAYLSTLGNRPDIFEN